ncbi:hypothetical protein [Pelosinus sp. sgz500959]|uniref:hypothetical protein n=1 Tax=Pelosinus sp. sgz500959 TaxID=3242472 RepID=UPI00366B7030
MDITLLSGVEQVINLGIDTSIITIINNGKRPIYVKNNASVIIGDNAAYIVPAETAYRLNFNTNNCRYLHLISESESDVGIAIQSIFKSIHRGDLVAGVETFIDFREPVSKYTVMNLSASDTLYFAVENTASIDGPGTIELPPGVIMSDDNVAVQKIHLISGGPARYQVTGQVR